MTTHSLRELMDLITDVEEGSMADAEHNPSGAKFGGYWGATQKGPPKPGQGFGGCEEGVEDPEESPLSDDLL